MSARLAWGWRLPGREVWDAGCPPPLLGIHQRGCSRRGVQRIGVVSYNKIIYSTIYITSPCFHCTPLCGMQTYAVYFARARSTFGRLKTTMWRDDVWQISNQVVACWCTFIQRQSHDETNGWQHSHHMIDSAFRTLGKSKATRVKIIPGVGNKRDKGGCVISVNGIMLINNNIISKIIICVLYIICFIHLIVISNISSVDRQTSRRPNVPSPGAAPVIPVLVNRYICYVIVYVIIFDVIMYCYIQAYIYI